MIKTVILAVMVMLVALEAKSRTSGTVLYSNPPSEKFLVVKPNIEVILSLFAQNSSIIFPGIRPQEYIVLEDGYGDGWLDTPYGSAENALKVPIEQIPAILLLLLLAGYGMTTRKRVRV